MRCHICNAELSPNEIKWSHAHNEWDPCNTCLNIIDEVFEDYVEDAPIVEEVELETLDAENST